MIPQPIPADRPNVNLVYPWVTPADLSDQTLTIGTRYWNYTFGCGVTVAEVIEEDVYEVRFTVRYPIGTVHDARGELNIGPHFVYYRQKVDGSTFLNPRVWPTPGQPYDVDDDALPRQRNILTDQVARVLWVDSVSNQCVDYRPTKTRHRRLQGNSPRDPSTPSDHYVPRTDHAHFTRRQNAVSDTTNSESSEGIRGDRQCEAALQQQELRQWKAPRAAPAHAHFDRNPHAFTIGSFATRRRENPERQEAWGWHRDTGALSEGDQSSTSAHSMPPPDLTLDSSTSNQNAIRRARLQQAATAYLRDGDRSHPILPTLGVAVLPTGANTKAGRRQVSTVALKPLKKGQTFFYAYTQPPPGPLGENPSSFAVGEELNGELHPAMPYCDPMTDIAFAAAPDTPAIFANWSPEANCVVELADEERGQPPQFQLRVIKRIAAFEALSFNYFGSDDQLSAELSAPDYANPRVSMPRRPKDVHQSLLGVGDNLNLVCDTRPYQDLRTLHGAIDDPQHRNQALGSNKKAKEFLCVCLGDHQSLQPCQWYSPNPPRPGQANWRRCPDCHVALDPSVIIPARVRDRTASMTKEHLARVVEGLDRYFEAEFNGGTITPARRTPPSRTRPSPRTPTSSPQRQKPRFACAVCERSGSIEPLVACDRCEGRYHPTCLPGSDMAAARANRRLWACPRCIASSGDRCPACGSAQHVHSTALNCLAHPHALTDGTVFDPVLFAEAASESARKRVLHQPEGNLHRTEVFTRRRETQGDPTLEHELANSIVNQRLGVHDPLGILSPTHQRRRSRNPDSPQRPATPATRQRHADPEVDQDPQQIIRQLQSELNRIRGSDESSETASDEMVEQAHQADPSRYVRVPFEDNSEIPVTYRTEEDAARAIRHSEHDTRGLTQSEARTPSRLITPHRSRSNLAAQIAPPPVYPLSIKTPFRQHFSTPPRGSGCANSTRLQPPCTGARRSCPEDHGGEVQCARCPCACGPRPARHPERDPDDSDPGHGSPDGAGGGGRTPRDSGRGSTGTASTNRTDPRCFSNSDFGSPHASGRATRMARTGPEDEKGGDGRRLNPAFAITTDVLTHVQWEVPTLVAADFPGVTPHTLRELNAALPQGSRRTIVALTVKAEDEQAVELQTNGDSSEKKIVLRLGKEATRIMEDRERTRLSTTALAADREPTLPLSLGASKRIENVDVLITLIKTRVSSNQHRMDLLFQLLKSDLKQAVLTWAAAQGPGTECYAATIRVKGLFPHWTQALRLIHNTAEIEHARVDKLY